MSGTGIRKTLLALVLIGMASVVAAAQHWYEPDQPGHGVTVQEVGDGWVVAQWYAHDGEGQRWFHTDNFQWGDPVEVFVVEADGWPADGAELVEAGEITLTPDGDSLILEYDLFIEEIDCGQVMVGPLPPDCLDADGNRLSDVVLQRGLDESGAVVLEPLIE